MTRRMSHLTGRGGVAVKIAKDKLEDAVRNGILSESQAESLWEFLLEKSEDDPSFKVTHILYYLGGLIAIGAMTLFMNLGWEVFGGWGIFAIAAVYGLFGLFLAERFSGKSGFGVPTGIMAVFATALVPLAVYGLQAGLGLWDGSRVYRDYHIYIDWRWMTMELAALAAGAAALKRYKIPFLVFPVAATLWYMSMDLAPFLFRDADLTWRLRRIVSLWFGLAMILFALRVDFRTRSKGDFAFWLYLFGLAAFWGGLSLLDSGSELGRFFYLCVNLLLIAAGAVLFRRVFVVFGGLGTSGYIGHLAWRVFENSALFPFVLSFVGFAVIWLGILWQRREKQVTAALRSFLPVRVREFLENGR